MTFHVVVPARYGSTRLPGKPLLDLLGKTMIQRVALQAMKSSAEVVVVATDDSRVAESAVAAGSEALITSSEHASGSDRVMEVAEKFDWGDDEIVVNVQGDEPLIPSEVIDQVAAVLHSQEDVGVATLMEVINDAEDVFNPNVVKVAIDARGRALYFSRAPIPWSRAQFGNDHAVELNSNWFRHIGIYAYRIWALRKFVNLPRSALETIESLEQLRFLENGVPIAVQNAVLPVPGGVDTPQDAERVRNVIARDC